jgi:hypothetical protein
LVTSLKTSNSSSAALRFISRLHRQ